MLIYLLYKGVSGDSDFVKATESKYLAFDHYSKVKFNQNNFGKVVVLTENSMQQILNSSDEIKYFGRPVTKGDLK